MSALKQQEASHKTVIHNVCVFDGLKFTSPRSIVIEGDKISRVAHGADQAVNCADEVINGEHGFLIPGLIDAHVHLHNEGHLRRLMEHGVTTALDMAMWPEEKMQALRGCPGLPDIRTAGLPATKAGSVHSHALPLPKEAFVAGPGDAKSFVQKRVREGSDYIKIIADIPGPDQETMDAIVKEAHRQEKMVVIHAADYGPFRMALEAKGDIITHVALDKAVDSGMAYQMQAANVISVPTLVMMEQTSKKPSFGAVTELLTHPDLLNALAKRRAHSLAKDTYANARDSVTTMHRAGVKILAGTDCHEEKKSLFDVRHGISMHQELELLVDAGLSNIEALRAATILPAEAFGLRDRGIIAEGCRADLVLMRDDPSKDISATRTIRHVWCNGAHLER